MRLESQDFRWTRFAPSPTGWLHLGHAAHALYVWAMARRTGARVLLRIEDHDRGRCRREYEDAILADLDWLGLAADWPARAEWTAPATPYRQSCRERRYAEILDGLLRRGLVYACACSRKSLMARTGQRGGELRYDNHCRDAGLPLDQGHGLRLRMPAASCAFDDLIAGPQVQFADAAGDVLLRDRHGQWTYNYAVVIDDFDQDIGLVVRGADLLAASGRQIAMAELLGRPAPARFAHHPLLMGGDGRKLSKRGRAEAVARRRQSGASREAALGEALYRLGLWPRDEPAPLEEALARIESALANGLDATQAPYQAST